jgi:hypothetical protein
MSRDTLWDEVQACAQTNAVLSQCLAPYLDGDCTLDEALMTAVLALAKANESYQRMVTNLIAQTPVGVA